MRRLRVGVWLHENYKPIVGGGFGYYSELINCISKTRFANADICFLGENILMSDIGYYKYHVLNWRPLKNKLFTKLSKIFGTRLFHISLIKNYYQNLDKKNKESLYSELSKICDIIYYPTPMCKYQDFPFIYTLWDLGHFSSFAFPEVCNEGIFEQRKDHHDKIPFKALMVFCESETGKKEAIYYLRLNKDRIRVLPLFPSGVISEKLIPVKPQAIDTDSIFILYPAQFWAHKNHYNLISAFLLITNKYPSLKLIFTGNDYGNKTYITKTINENNLGDRIFDLGFVSLEELKWLYIHSKGLIMPSLLGPTNMPPLEALSLGCPVAVSDLPGHREQFGENAIYFNPLDIEEIKNAIEILLCQNPISIPPFKTTIDSNMILLDKYFAELKIIRHTWA